MDDWNRGAGAEKTADQGIYRLGGLGDGERGRFKPSPNKKKQKMSSKKT